MFSILISSIYQSLIYTVKTGIVIIVTLFFMNYIISRGFLKYLEMAFYPILKRIKANPISISSMLSCFLSPTVGYSILAEGYNNKLITEKEVLASSLANSFPSVFSHIFTFFIPITIPLLGVVGVILVLIRLGIALLKTLIGLIWLSLLYNGNDNLKINKINKKKNVKDIIKSTLKLGRRIITVMFITFTIIFFLSKVGFFDYVNKAIYPITSILNLNPNVGILTLTEIVNVQAAIVLASGLLNENILSGRDVLIGLILGNIISFSSKYVRHSLPLQVSLFGKLGVKIVLLNAIITLLLDIIIVFIIISLPPFL